MKHPCVNKAKNYIRDVLNGSLSVGKYVFQACERHMKDLDRSKGNSFPYRFDLDTAERVCIFAENMVHTKGKWTGSKIVLEPWQCFFITSIFGWIHKSSRLRRFREVYGEIPRKNGKSILGAIIGNYMLSSDGEEGSEVYSGATSEKQALEVFRPAWLMTKKNRQYSNFFNLRLSGTFKNPKSVYCVDTSSRFEPVVGNPGDGSSPHCAIIDEYHEHKTSTLYDSMATGMGSRQQPLQVVITTAGTDTSSPCYEKRQQCVSILDGKTENDNIFTIIYSIDPEDDWSDFENWKKANPNFGVSIFPDYLKKQHLDALQSASKQNIIRCKHLDQWCNAGVAYYNMLEWSKCKDSNTTINDFTGASCWIGVDLASKIDIAAMVPMFKKGEEYWIFPHFYIPEERIKGDDMSTYAGWVHDGYMTATPGSRIDFDYIQEDIIRLNRKFVVEEIPHDPWNAAQFVTNMMKSGFIMVEIGQTVSNLSEPLKESEALIKEGKLHHDGNPVMEWMMGNVIARVDKNDNVFPYKEREKSKIDGPIAMILALSRAMHARPFEVLMPIAM
jgi:phage terminase large subunit-like protein